MHSEPRPMPKSPMPCRLQPGRAFSYRLSGLTISSELELPSAFQSTSPAQQAQVTIRKGNVPKMLAGSDDQGEDWQRTPKQFLLNVPSVGRFLVSDGDSILFELCQEADPGDVALYLQGVCLAILLQQRGGQVLHASAVAVANRAMLFCGRSGVGKSTIAALLCQKGYPLLVDDACNINLTPSGQYAVRADGRMLKLWAQSLNHLPKSLQQGAAVRADTDKFYVRPPRSDAASRSVAGIYLLVECRPEQKPSLERLSPLQAMLELRANAYRTPLIEAMGMELDYFAVCARLQHQAGVYLLRRPKDFTRANEVVALLQRHWKQNGIIAR